MIVVAIRKHCREVSSTPSEDSCRPHSGCAINVAVEALGDHWSVLVLRDIIFGDRRHFRELLTGSLEGIASNILADRLKRLVAAGILVRDDAARGQRVRYSLTEAGIETLPISYALGCWGLDCRTGTPQLRARQELMRQQGPAFVEELMDELRTRHLDQPRPHDDRPLPSERLRRPTPPQHSTGEPSGEQHRPTAVTLRHTAANALTQRALGPCLVSRAAADRPGCRSLMARDLR